MDIKKLNEELAHLLNENKSYFVSLDGERVSDYYDNKAAAIAWAEENYSIDDDRIAIEDCTDDCILESTNEDKQSVKLKLVNYMDKIALDNDALDGDKATAQEVITWIFEHRKEAYTKKFWIEQVGLSEQEIKDCGISEDLDESFEDAKNLLSKYFDNAEDIMGTLKDQGENPNETIDIINKLVKKAGYKLYDEGQDNTFVIDKNGNAIITFYVDDDQKVKFGELDLNESKNESYVIMYDDGEMDLDNELSLEQLVDMARCETSEEIYSEKEAIDALSKKGYKVFMMEGLNEDLAYEESLMDTFETVRGAIETAMHHIKLESKPVNFNRIANAMTQLKLAADAYELANDPEYNGRPRNEVLKSCYNFVQEAKKHLG